MKNHEQAFTAARLILDDPNVSASIRNLAVCYLVMRHDYTPAQGRVIVDLKAALEAANETVKALQELIAEKDAVLTAYKADFEAAKEQCNFDQALAELNATLAFEGDTDGGNI
jgi:hypothetical protein